jgi:CMP-N,N'-diacetyllegionaminic acid synthase
MIAGQAVLALIPARGGSQGLPGKNLAVLAGKSLVSRAIHSALASKYVDRVILSSDDVAIINEGTRAGAEAPFVRPAELSNDTATSATVMLHAIRNVGHLSGFAVLLQPTSPFRTGEDIDRCIEVCATTGASACLSVVELKANPYVMYWRNKNGILKPVLHGGLYPTRRQDLPPAYTPNGAVYVVRVETFLALPDFAPPETLGHVMPMERSLDIDSADDLAVARALID